jgi:hypothetical protein
MSEESKKTEQIKQVPATELSEQDLDNVAGGTAYTSSKSGIKSSPLVAPAPAGLSSPTTQKSVKQGGVGN